MTERTKRSAATDLGALAASCAVVVAAVVVWALISPVALREGLGNRGLGLPPAIYCCSFMSWRVNAPRLLLTSVIVAVVVMGLRRLAPLRTALASAVLTASCVLISLIWMVGVVLIPATGAPGAVPRGQPALLTLWLGWLVLPLLAAWIPRPLTRFEPDP